MLDELTRRVRGWLHGPGTAAATGERAPRVPGDVLEACETGAADLRAGRVQDALAAFERAALACPAYAPAHDQAGLALRALGRNEDALARFERALDAQPDYLPALTHQGATLAALGRHDDAEDCFKVALAHDPGSAELYVQLALACASQRRIGDAVGHFRRALELDSGCADAGLLLAGLLHAEGRLEEAAASYRQALAVRPGLPELRLNYGLTLLRLGSVDDAAAELERAVALRPDFAEAHFNLGNARGEQGRAVDAIACYERALELKPDFADAWNNYGSALKAQGDVDRAIESYRRAAALNPQSVEPLHNLGVLYSNLGRPREAIPCYEAAQKVRPGHPDSKLNLAIVRLQAGDFDPGWEDYEWRFHQTRTELGAQTRSFPYPRWAGEPLAGRSILVWGEQGIGDEILFSSMYGEVAAAAQRCVIECAPKLIPLFVRSFPGARVVPKADPPHPETHARFDYQSPAGSLARWLRPRIGSFPARHAHLAAAPHRVSSWKDRLARIGAGLKVGFSWRSTNVNGDRALACTVLEQWEAILAVAGVQFVCLQYDECSAELAHARQRFGVDLHAFPEVDLFNDLDEAAALTQALDLVISAPTAVSLLSAALGVPTWQMSYGADWQVHGTDRNPWFPAMIQFKRAWDEQWETVIAVVAERLRQQVAQAAGGARAASKPADEGANMSGKLEHGDALLRQNRLLEARAEFELQVAGEPRSAQAWLGLARASRGLDRLQAAAESYERAIELDSELAGAALELGIVRYQQGRLDEADAAYGRVLEREPGHLAARLNRALTSYQRGDVDAAIAGNEAVLRERPDHPEAHFNLGIALLARGEFVRGWQEYEWRFDQATLEDRNRSFPFQRWEGEDPGGKTVLAWKEQSIGGQILFAGMFPELIERAGYCIIECTAKLVPLFARSFPDCDVVPRTDPPHPYTQQAIDFQVPVASLGRWLRRSLEDFPARAAYLAAEPARVAYWRERLQRLGPGPKIGFSWRSINVSGERSLACTLIEQWEPVLRIPGATFVCLQYDECADELERARGRAGAVVHEFRDIDMFNDLDEAAALMRALDLVVSAPTAVTVLSSALGVPTWQLHHGTDWQMHGAPRHPWLRSLRRFQRGLYQPWEEVMEEVAAELTRWLAARGNPGA